jgi:hypothetical protein
MTEMIAGSFGQTESAFWNAVSDIQSSLTVSPR